jgi:hypothetical protein
MFSPGRSAVLFGVLVTAACSVPDKHSGDPDAGTPPGGDAGGDAGGGGGDAGTPPIDTDAPDTTIDDAPREFSNEHQATFRFSSNDPSATFSCRVDQGAAAPCQSPYTQTLADGSHNFSVHAIDAAGNGDDTPAERVWTIDTVAPDTILTDKPPAADNSTSVVFKFTSNEANVTFECALDVAVFSPCVSGATFGPIGDGAHSFNVRARDRAGNIDPSPQSSLWSVDTRTPDTQIQSGPADIVASSSATFIFSSPDAGAGSTFECALDTAGFTACTSPVTYTGLGEATHTFRVRVKDAVGNVDPSPADASWTVDLTPPDTTITSAGPTGTLGVASASFTFTSNEPTATFACKLDAAAFAPCTSPAALTGLGQGAHTFAVQATDAAGHTDASPATRTWTVDTVAPDVSITAGPAEASTVGPRVVFAFNVSDGTVACSLDGAAFAPCTSPIGVNLPAAAHRFAVRATDGVGNVMTSTRTWTVACSAPAAASAAGVLHFDGGDQIQPDGVAGGADATLGDTMAAESGDPTPLANGRFGGGLSFSAAAGDHVAWPIALTAMPDLTLELWSQPVASSGPRDVVISSDGRIALRVTADTPITVRFSISIAEGGDAGQTRTVASAPVQAGVWHHVLASLQQPVLRLWVDGVRTDVSTVQLASPPGLDALRLGGVGAAGYDGALDEVWLSQTAITGDEPALARYCPL